MLRTALTFTPLALVAMLASAGDAQVDAAAVDLVGLPVQELSNQLVPPSVIRGGDGGGWAWGTSGEAQHTLRVVSGRVVWLSEGFDAHGLKATSTRPAAPFLGQPLGELLDELGPAEAVAYPPDPVPAHARPPMDPFRGARPPEPRLVWGETWVRVENDVVVEITPPMRPAPVTGPR